jgi:HlyD family type I secretion membrane fusion protein
MATLLLEDLTGNQSLAVNDDIRPERRLAIIIASLFFVGFVGWASLTPLDAGAYARGIVAVAGNRQAVQHREGGIVTGLMIKEGALVQKGQPLISISATDVQAAERGLTAEYLMLLAERSRLSAERSGGGLVIPQEFAALSEADRALADQAMRGQYALMDARRSTARAQKSVLGQQSAQVNAKISGFDAQTASNREQRRLIEQELEGMRRIAEKGFASINRIRQLERAAASLDGDAGSKTADIAAARESIEQTRMQSLVLDRDLIEKADERLHDVTQRINEVQPRLAAAREQLARAVVRAPAAGRVVGLAIFTVGGVVAPGQVLMEVVPQDRELIIKAQISPDDADDVREGSRVKVRFPSLHDRSLPDVAGRIRTISADSLTDEKTGVHYFAAEVHVPSDQLRDLTAGKLRRNPIQAGLPVEILAMLQKRTVLDYLVEPIVSSFWRTGREH